MCYAVPAEKPRAAVVVSKSVGNAPVRNRVRRRIRHILADVLPTLSADIVVRALPPSAHASWVDLREATLSGLVGIRAPR
jgi:ribonuclease P protein component